jgi:hypothetical protein
VGVTVTAELLVPGGATALDSAGELIELTPPLTTQTNGSGLYLFDPAATPSNGLIATGDIYQWQSGSLVALPGCLWQISYLTTTLTGSFAYSATPIQPSMWLPATRTLGLFKMYLVDVAGNALAQAGTTFTVNLGADAVWSGGAGAGQNVSAAAAFSATTDSSGTVSYWLIRQSELGGGYYQAVEQQPGSRILQFTCPSLYTNDAGSWLVGTTYALNAVVRDPATDIPYISLGAGNVGHPPASSPANWALYAGEKITAHPTVGVPPASVAFGQANLLADNAVATGTYAVPPITLQDQLRQLTQIQARHVTAATDTATYDDDVLDLDGTANAVTETLPTAVGWTKFLLLKCINVTHAVTIGTTSAQTIDGASTLTPALNVAYLLYSNGSNWQIGATANIGGGGSSAFSWSTKTTTYTITTADTGILADATSAAFTVTLPTAVGATQQYVVKRKNSGANAVTVGTTSSQTIDGATTFVLSTQYQSITLGSDNANWYIA